MKEINLHVIQKGDTMIGIAKQYRLENPNNWEEDIWNHEFNKAIRTTWPENMRTEKLLPIGYGLYVPGSNPFHERVDKDKPVKRYKEVRRLLNALHFDIYYYDTYQTYGYYPEHYNREPDDEKGSPYKYMQQSGFTVSQLTAASIVQQNTGCHASTYFDDTVKEYKCIERVQSQVIDAGSCHGTPSRAKVTRYIDHGNYGAIQGDPTKSSPMEEGWVYIFEKDGAAYKLKAYQASKTGARPTSYQEMDVSADVPSPVGSAKEYMEIEGFFPLNREDLETMGPYYVVASSIPLSKDRLDQLKQDPSKRGKKLIQSDILLLDTTNSNCSTEKVHEVFVETNGKVIVNTQTHDFQVDKIGDKYGFHLFLPNIEQEALRRNDEYTKKYNKFIEWQNNKKRNKKAFVHDMLDQILSIEEQSKYLNASEFFGFKHATKLQLMSKWLPCHYTLHHLIEWLTSPIFKEVVIDYTYNFGIDIVNDVNLIDDLVEEEANKPDYHFKIFNLLGQVYQNISNTNSGLKFLMKERENLQSIYNLLLAEIAKKTDMGVLVASSSQSNKSKFNNNSSKGGVNSFNAARKINGHAIKLITEYLPAVAKLYSSNKTKKSTDAFLANITKNAVINFTNHRLYKSIGYFVKETELGKINKLLNKGKFKLIQVPELDLVGDRLKSISSHLNAILQLAHMIDAILTTEGQSDQMIMQDYRKAWIANGGAILDFITSFDYVAAHINKKLVATKGLEFAKMSKSAKFMKWAPVLSFVSSMIDFFLEIDTLSQLLRKGETTLAIASSITVIGYAFGVAASYILMTEAGKAALAAGLLTSETGVGLFICGIGAAICFALAAVIKASYKNEFQKWALTSEFSINPDAKLNLDDQIKNLYDVLTKFYIEAEVDISPPMITVNPRMIPDKSVLGIKLSRLDIRYRPNLLAYFDIPHRNDNEIEFDFSSGRIISSNKKLFGEYDISIVPIIQQQSADKLVKKIQISIDLDRRKKVRFIAGTISLVTSESKFHKKFRNDIEIKKEISNSFYKKTTWE